jgi:hypothetical protein
MTGANDTQRSLDLTAQELEAADAYAERDNETS